MINTRIPCALLRYAVPVFCAAMMIGCSDSPTEPSPSAPSLAGTWTGTYRVASCRGGYQACFGIKDSYAMRLEITETANGLSGRLSGDAPAGSIAGSIALNGTIDGSTIHLAGSQPYVSQPLQAGIEVGDWSTTVNDARTAMSGGFELMIKFRTNNVYPDEWRIETAVVSLQR